MTRSPQKTSSRIYWRSTTGHTTSVSHVSAAAAFDLLSTATPWRLRDHRSVRDPGVERPWVCISNADGTCPHEWMDSLKRCLEERFGPNVTINHPFKGGYITRTHASEMPWVQLELSRAPFASNQQKREHVLAALTAWTSEVSR